jgi:hypothetical protein
MRLLKTMDEVVESKAATNVLSMPACVLDEQTFICTNDVRESACQTFSYDFDVLTTEGQTRMTHRQTKMTTIDVPETSDDV